MKIIIIIIIQELKLDLHNLSIQSVTIINIILKIIMINSVKLFNQQNKKFLKKFLWKIVKKIS